MKAPDIAALKADAEFRGGAMKCVRCSICVPRCPSYAVFRNEADSPRGRVQLMRAAVEGRVEIDDAFEQHMDKCLGCRACEDVCPSAVPFGYLIDRTREVLAARPHLTGRKKATRAGLALLSRPRLLLWLARFLRIVQWLWLDRLARWVVAPFSRKTARRFDQLPRVTGAPFNPRAATSDASATVQMFTGCVMAATLGDVQRSTIGVLRESGHAVGVPPKQVCCGALHLHAGQREMAMELARKNIAAFEESSTPICINSAGCGLAMKEYGKLLAEDPAWADRAAAFSKRVRDFEEIAKPRSRSRQQHVAVQEACHHFNVQRIRGRAATLLAAAGYPNVVTLPRGTGCCGSAGLFSAMHPDAAWQLLNTFLDGVERSGCHVVASSNPGCLMFIRAGLRARGSRLRAAHLADLLGPDGDDD